MTDITEADITKRAAIHVLGWACWLMANELAALTGEDARSLWRAAPGSGTAREIMRGRRTKYADRSTSELLDIWAAGINQAFDHLAHEIADRTPTGQGKNHRAASRRAVDIRQRYLGLVERAIESGGVKLTMGANRHGSVTVGVLHLPTFDLADYFPS